MKVTQELIQEAKRRYPSGCSYIHAGGEKCDSNIFKNIYYNDNDVFQTNDSTIALSKGMGLVYDDGKWAILVDKNGNEIHTINEPTYEIY